MSLLTDHLFIEYVQPDTSNLGECEFWLISELNAQLIVHHAYPCLTALERPLSLTTEDVSLAWSIINDHYLTSIPLNHAPQIVAAMAVSMVIGVKRRQAPQSQNQIKSSLMGNTLQHISQFERARVNTNSETVRQQKLISWLAESGIDISEVISCTQEMISLYKALELYQEQQCRELLARCIKAQNAEGRGLLGTLVHSKSVLLN